MSELEADLGIVGAGLCGLTVARQSMERGCRTFVVEKSRGVGGRMATRRTEGHRFDHGAQFYVPRPEIAVLHAAWRAADLVRPWGTFDGHARFAAPAGMTALAKHLARDVPVHLGEKIVRIESRGDSWWLHAEAGGVRRAHTVVLTCPLPQARDLLRQSGLAYPADLDDIAYDPALVALVEDPVSPAGLGADGLAIEPGADVSSIADQSSKGVSPRPAWTVTMTPAFSRAHLDDPRALDRILDRLRALDPEFACARAELKTWRYAQPRVAAAGSYAEVAPALFLAGDGFGGPSLNGAVRSSAALIDRLSR